MLDASSVFYMNKIVTGPEGAGVVDLRQSIGDNIRELAKKKGKDVGEIRVAVLDRPRHEGLIDEIRSAGAGTRLMLDGDVAGGINAARYESRIDMCVGIGGSPEGITTACAIKAIGGFMQGQLAPRDDAEREKARAAGLDYEVILEADDMVKGDNTFFVATGVTDGGLVEGVRRKGPIIRTESIVLRSRSGTIRRIVADHLAEKWL
jgi:fructose-1,6-bisphosphatase II